MHIAAEHEAHYDAHGYAVDDSFFTSAQRVTVRMLAFALSPRQTR